MKRLLLLFGILSCWISGYSQTYTFVTGGAEGQNGPTQSELDAAYLGTNLAGAVTSNAGIQYWVVPSTGTYTITALGAQGYGPFGGRGASMSGDFTLNSGDTLKILVGQEGAPPVGAGTNQHGGGGGSFVTYTDNTPIIVAGGGGGSWASAFNATTDASIGTAGNTAANGPTNGTGGTAGQGGSAAASAGGGGGLLGDGGLTNYGGKAFINGGQGGIAATNGAEGGFGGGGGANSWDNRRGGGGGGYSGGGGAGSTTTGFPEGGGGGSYNSGSNPVNIAGVQLGDGSVIISALSTGATNDAGVISLESPISNGFCPGSQSVDVTIQNFGGNQITSLTVNWSIDGVAQTPYSFTGVLDTFGGLGSPTAQITLGTYNFPGTSVTLDAWTAMPNGSADTVTYNDTLTRPVMPGISAPANVTVSNVLATSADISWNAMTIPEYVIIYGTAGFDPAAGGTSVTVTTNSGTISSGISGSSAYDVYVVGGCGSGVYGDTAGPVTFLTPCVVATAPYVNDFEDNTVGFFDGTDFCWTILNSKSFTSATGGFSWEVRNTAQTSSGTATGPDGDNTLGPAMGGQFVTADVSYGVSGDSTTIISPPVDISTLTAPELRFYYHRWGTATLLPDLKVDVSNDGGTTWTNIMSITGVTQTAPSDPYNLAFTPLSSYMNDTVQVRFTLISAGCCAGDVAIDDFSIDNEPPCPEPLFLSVADITSTSAEISFSSSGSSFDYEWDVTGFTQGTGANTITGGTNPDTLTGLLPNTTYDVYVRRNCTGAGNGTSVWSGPITFQTRCAPFTAPYVQDFDGVPANSMDNCWSTITEGSGTTANVVQTYTFTTPQSGVNHVRMYNGNNRGPGEATALVSPAFSDMSAGDKQIQFYAKASTTAGEKVYVGSMSDPADFTTFDTLGAYDLSTTHTLYTMYVNTSSGYNGTDQYFAFAHGNTADFNTVYIDSVAYSTAPACAPPVALGAGQITSSSAIISFATAGSPSGFDFEYDTTGFAMGTGRNTITGGTNPDTLTGLMSNTSYDVYVRADCGGGTYSAWAGPFTFRTLCAPFTAPYSTGFDNQPTNEVPYCWTAITDNAGGTANVILTYSAVTPNSPPNHIRMYNGSNLNNEAATILVSPELSDLPQTDKQIEFFAKASTAGETVIVGTLSNPTDSGSFTAIDTFALTTTHTQFFMDMDSASAYNRTDKYIGFKHGNGATFRTVYIDDFIYRVKPPCQDPFGEMQVGATATSVDISLGNSDTTYQYNWGPVGFNQATGTVGNGVGNPFTINGMQPNTQYDVYIRTNCSASGSGFSQWIGPLVVQTACVAFTAPYSQDFENGFNVGFYDGEQNCWTLQSGASPLASLTSGFTWELRNSIQTGSSNTGAAGDNTLYPNIGGNFFSANVSYTNGDSTMLISPVIDISPLANPGLKFYLHRYGTQMADFAVDIYDGTQWIQNVYLDNNLTGNQTSSSDPYEEIIIDLSPYAGTTNLRARFKAISNGCCSGDPALDDISFFDQVAEDVALINGEFSKNTPCYSSADTLLFDVVNNLGDTIDFTVNPLTINFDVSGPVNTNSSVVVNTGTLNTFDTLRVYATNVDLSLPGTYTLDQAYILGNATNLDPLNDTLNAALGVSVTVDTIFRIKPKSYTFLSLTDSVKLNAYSPFFGGGDFMITEICHWRSASSGAPAAWPSYLTADDYIEITGIPGADLAGYTLEQWSTTSMTTTQTFGTGTVIGPNGTAIITTGTGAGADDPANFMYNGVGSGSAGWGSTGAAGRIIKDPSGNIIDAVAYAGSSSYTFPAASGVTAADWSGSVPTSGSTAGIRLEGADDNTATNWVASATSPQDPNVLNPNVPLPAPSSATGFTWSLNGNVVSNNPQYVVKASSITPGTYTYVATFNSPCGPVYTDSAIITLSNCLPPSNFMVMGTSATAGMATWDTTALGNSTYEIEYGPAGFTPGNGTLVTTGAVNSYSITGLDTNLCQDFYIRNACGGTGSASAWIGPMSLCPQVIPCDDFEAYATGSILNQSSLIIPWENSPAAVGGGEFSSAQAQSGTQSLYVNDLNGPTDLVALFDTIDSGIWSINFSMYIVSSYGGYFNIQQNHDITGGANHFWAANVVMENGTGTVREGGANTGPLIGTFTYTQDQWFDMSTVIDFDNDTAWVEYNGVSAGGWVYSNANPAEPLQANGINFYTGATTNNYYVDNFCVSPYIPTLVCDPPTNVSGAAGCDTINVSWNNSTGMGVITYLPLGSSTPMVAATTDSSITLTGLTPGTTYNYQVANICSNGDTSVAVTGTAVTLSLPVADIQVLGDTTINGVQTFDFDASGSVGATSYSWDFGNGTTGTGAQASGSYSTNGTYTVYLTATNDCGSVTDSVTISVNIIGLADNALSRSLNVYPNPTSNLVNITFEGATSSDVTIRLMDASGREMMQLNDNINGRYNGQLDVSKLSKGIYLIEIQAGELRAQRRLSVN